MNSYRSSLCNLLNQLYHFFLTFAHKLFRKKSVLLQFWITTSWRVAWIIHFDKRQYLCNSDAPIIHIIILTVPYLMIVGIPFSEIAFFHFLHQYNKYVKNAIFNSY